MSTPERQQDPGEHSYGGVKQDPSGDEEREETPQERHDEEAAAERRLAEEQGEAQAEPTHEVPPRTDEQAQESQPGDG